MIQLYVWLRNKLNALNIRRHEDLDPGNNFRILKCMKQFITSSLTLHRAESLSHAKDKLFYGDGLEDFHAYWEALTRCVPALLKKIKEQQSIGSIIISNMEQRSKMVFYVRKLFI